MLGLHWDNENESGKYSSEGKQLQRQSVVGCITVSLLHGHELLLRTRLKAKLFPIYMSPKPQTLNPKYHDNAVECDAGSCAPRSAQRDVREFPSTTPSYSKDCILPRRVTMSDSGHDRVSALRAQ